VFGAAKLDEAPSHDGHGLGHGQDQAVPLGPASEGKPDSRVPRGQFSGQMLREGFCETVLRFKVLLQDIFFYTGHLPGLALSHGCTVTPF
jgi:hypothetical protein